MSERAEMNTDSIHNLRMQRNKITFDILRIPIKVLA